jgi:hypothetical protein
MELNVIIDLVGAAVICGTVEGKRFETGFSSDLMSDVLTIDSKKMLLITGMANIQTIRTAEMADISCILLVRNKRANKEMVDLAKELGITILETCHSLYKTSGILYLAGLKPVY